MQNLKFVKQIELIIIIFFKQEAIVQGAKTCDLNNFYRWRGHVWRCVQLLVN